eukprot:1185124-Amphidinium_carterae.1
MSIPAEVGAIIKDVSRKPGASAQAADVPSSTQYPKKDGNGNQPCQNWGSKAGCTFGATCASI